MKIQYCSDLHLEFEENTRFLEKSPLVPVGDILVLAGDITYMRKDFYQHVFFDYLSKNWKQVFWVPGNHEYYCGIDVKNYDFSKPIKIRENIFLVNNYSIVIENVHFIFSTLWSKINKQHEILIEQNVADFHLIVINEQKLTSKTFNQLHKKSINYIKNELQKDKTIKKVIVTHHLPSKKCNHSEFEGTKINSAFCVDLTEFIEKSNVNTWIYGHSHRNMPEFSIGKTRLVTNQLGYVKYNEHNTFLVDKIIEI